MATTLVPKLAMASAAAIALYVPTLGLPLPGSCERTGSVASAAPSPTCASDLRDCLRVSAREGLYGVRYVTAEDVARCMEIFNSCIHGGASSGGNRNPPASTATGGSNNKGLPQHFGISAAGSIISDCRLSGATVTCTTIRHIPLAEGQDSWAGGATGTLSGMTVTGTETIRIEGHYSGEPGCLYTQEGTGPVTYSFKSDGTVTVRGGGLQWRKTNHGSCSAEESSTSPATEWTGTWSAIE